MKAKEAREKYLPKLYSIQRNLGEALTEEQRKDAYYSVRIKDILNEVTEVIQALQTYNDDFDVYENEIEMKLRMIREEIADLPLIRKTEK
ncbi:hypothetical protein [Sulfolobus acidocaldarius]|uniref:Uncharacterized protein n=1 Tax=Sulfolobus acidocaldarius TaxID=2285 RepID=A0A0U3GRF9_9CREN|nr:hypothetical protein [Sulfolobus acidocaldarius]ALU30872.1 hypothetical protein ATZ20_01095 [Sulfolobus acidocaldarius]